MNRNLIIIPYDKYKKIQEDRNRQLSGPVKSYQLPREEIDRMLEKKEGQR